VLLRIELLRVVNLEIDRGMERLQHIIARHAKSLRDEAATGRGKRSEEG
jgi:hypothetical protein